MIVSSPLLDPPSSEFPHEKDSKPQSVRNLHSTSKAVKVQESSVFQHVFENAFLFSKMRNVERDFSSYDHVRVSRKMSHLFLQ